MQSRRAVAAVIIVVAFASLLVGCGGSSSPPPVGPPPPGPISLTVNLTAADSAAAVFPSANLTLLPSGATGVSGSNGSFTFTGLQSMPTAVQVTPVYQPSYAAAQVNLPTTTQTSLTVDIALLPYSAGTVTSIALNPQAQEVQIGTRLQFTASIVTSAGTTGLSPTWFSVGTAGSIQPGPGPGTATFTTTHVGSSTIYVFSGDLFTSTTLTVTGLTGPQIVQVLVDPLQLPSGGGPVVITAPIIDPVGIPTVQALIFHPNGVFTQLPMALVAGTGSNGTFRVTYQVPANGTQTQQKYQVRVRAVDTGGRVTLSKLVPFTVLGLHGPPPPPG
jgi:hypothetical protein